jgi:hypothetical protein
MQSWAGVAATMRAVTQHARLRERLWGESLLWAGWRSWICGLVVELHHRDTELDGEMRMKHQPVPI